MTSALILRNLERLERKIVQEEVEIQIFFIRIRQVRENFMGSHKARTLRIKGLKNEILAARKRINDLKARMTIITTT